VNNPAPEEDTGKKVAIIGGGPSGLAAAYYLRLMGHSVSIFDRKNKLGGMLRYGIPSYRFPREQLDKEIESILELGIDIHTDCAVGKDITLAKLNREYDAIYIAIGAQIDNKLGIPGENAKKVVSAVSVLRGIGDGIYPDFANKRIVVVGGGNVAMDATRTALRLGASKVTTVYRRRIEDMTALPEEVDGALKEGAEILSLMAPIKIQTGKDGAAVSLIAQPQIPGEIDKAGRPRPIKADAEPVEIPADVIIMAVGQAIESDDFANAGVPVEKSKILAGLDCHVKDKKKIFAGGDCVTGPSTAIEAIAAGKVAAAQIDEYLGYAHSISTDIEIPEPRLRDFVPAGRINSSEREAGERAHDFCDVAHCMSKEEAERESARCLRCDHFGYGSFRGGRTTKW
ncbi:MAG: FAD-dependent oxidoreductase, partial [Lachnospiraceae bacterium]|nr:FAD-dependent oxidoreductase [Candidatus Minthocola equi]